MTTRLGWLRRAAVAGLTTIMMAGGMLTLLPQEVANATSAAAFTTTDNAVDGGTQHCRNGNQSTTADPVNCNIYDGKDFVWLNGGPSVAALSDGSYFFAVLDPGGQADPNDGSATLLSTDLYGERSFSVSGGVVTYSGSTHTTDGNKIRLQPYANTANPGGVYILAICSAPQPVDPSGCKYDAFKVADLNTPPASPLTVTKGADGAYTNSFTWTIKKAVDKTLVEQVGGTATFKYTVTVQHDAGTVSGVTVKGTISVFNPNVDGSGNVLPVDIDGVTDTLSDGTNCTVTGGGSQTLTLAKTDFVYECDLAALPQGELDNTATVDWSSQVLANGAFLAGDSADFTFTSISFAATAVDNCVNVSDTNAAGPQNVQVCVGDTNPAVFNYNVTVNVPAYNCVSYDNTATFTTNTNGATGSASTKVEVCGPAKTGALTMGYWQNKNGQAIITGQAKTGTCPSATWLRLYGPFQDLSATSTCSAVGTYVTNIIKSANASGSAMNAMLKAQMLSTALDVYFSDVTLGGNKIAAPARVGGVKVDLTKICKMIDSSGGTATCSVNFENTSGAFGGATSLTVSQLLAYAASQSNAGGSSWYGQVKATQGLAKDTFDAINNQVVFSP